MATTTVPATTEPRRAGLGAAAVGLAVVSWGLGGVLVKLSHVPGLVLACYRLWLGFFFMWAVAAASGKRLTARVVKASALGGLLFGADVTVYFSALKLTSVANASLIAALQPALVLLVAGRWLGERVGLREIGWTATSLAGVAVVVIGSAGAPKWSPAGDALAVLATVCFSGYFVVSKRTRDRLGALEYITGVMLWAAAVSTPVALLSGQRLGITRGLDFFWLVLFVIGPGGGHILVSWAFRHIDVTVSSLLVVGVPVVGVWAGWLILGEHIGWPQAVGGVIVLIALIAISVPPRRRPRLAGAVGPAEPAALR